MNRLFLLTSLYLVALHFCCGYENFEKGSGGVSIHGDEGCRCLSSEESSQLSEFVDPYESFYFQAELGFNVNQTTYGIGCGYHDYGVPECAKSVNDCLNKVPIPLSCANSWCRRAWCYVNPNACTRKNTIRSFKYKSYSYATCGDMDIYTVQSNLDKLKGGEPLKIALNSNTGGWKGAYNPKGSFAIDQNWYGPLYKFIEDVAKEGGFQLNITRPPEWLQEESKRFFGDSDFDYCVYAAALGYVDMCVSAYSITNARSQVAKFFDVTNNEIYLVTFVKEGGEKDWEEFRQSVLTIFQPFQPSTWLFLIFFLFPLLGILMVFHEYGSPGSSFLKSAWVLVTNRDTNVGVVQRHDIPIWKHVVTAIYMSFLAFFQGSYSFCVFSLGGKITALGMSALIMLVLAVYTANLASILTQKYTRTGVKNLDEAIEKGYTFCAARKVYESASAVHDKLKPNQFVPDPISLGGDGMAGFNCRTCGARNRVFEKMRSLPPHRKDPSVYCDAALVSLEDLEEYHGRGEHCEKKRVGDPIAIMSLGFPIFDEKSETLVSLLQMTKKRRRIRERVKFGKTKDYVFKPRT